MKILMDLQSCQSPGSRNRGIGRYSMSLAQAIVKEAPENEYWVLLNGAFPESAAEIVGLFYPGIPATRFVTFSPPWRCGEEAIGSACLIRAAELIRLAVIKKIQPDVVHVASFFEGPTDGCVVSLSDEPVNYANVVTLYDLIPICHPAHYLANQKVKNNYLKKLHLLTRADMLLCISAYSAAQGLDVLTTLTPEKVVNISSAVDDDFFYSAESDVATSITKVETYGITKPFVMYTGGIDWRKNINGLLKAFSLLPSHLKASHQLVLVCKIAPEAEKALRAVCKSLKLSATDVIFTGYVPDEALRTLYRATALFVFPSLHEGFGLPALEAMKCGAPVVGSNASSIPEVIGNADALFNPADPKDIANLMARVLTDEQFRNGLKQYAAVQAKEFSWSHTARLAIDAMQLARYRHKTDHPTEPNAAVVGAANSKPALAMFTPLPPAKSGIADYSQELLAVLHSHYDVTVICDQLAVNRAANSGYTVQTVSWFRKNAASFDRVVYQFGNSDFHAHMFRLLQEFPGAVVLHDFFLSGVLNWMESGGRFPGVFNDALARSHGNDGVVFERQHGRTEAIAAYPCNSAVAERALGVIVHSANSIELAQKYYGNAFSEQWQVIPLLRSLPATNGRDAARKLLGIKDDELLVCSFGHLSAGKLNDRLLHAWKNSSLVADNNCRLVFVGQNDPGLFGQAIKRDIFAAESSRQIAITGFTSAETFEAYLAAADIAVQLRTNSRGETSKAVIDCLANQLPVILNANGSMNDYPSTAVYKMIDDFSDQDLIDGLEFLKQDHAIRRKLADAGLDWVKKIHDPKAIALQYSKAIENFYTAETKGHYWDLIDSIAAQNENAAPIELREVAAAVSRNLKII